MSSSPGPEFFTQGTVQDDLQVDFVDSEEWFPNFSVIDLVRIRTAFNFRVISNHLNNLGTMDVTSPTSSGIGQFYNFRSIQFRTPID